MIRAEYLRFLQILIGDEVHADVRKIANLALQHLDVLIPLTTAHGQRIKKVVELAEAQWATVSADIQPAPEETIEHTCPITQLKSLSVGPFRGFAKQEVFDLASQLILVYGPNGTGKSSFCEALEYVLLGNVVEAESKRFENQQDYLKNAHINSFEAPVLTGTSDQGEEIPISANEPLYRFCFVEKNRIDSFSRIAAKTPAKQTELISTLFGLDAFAGFVHDFTTDIDERHIDLEGIKAKELDIKRQTLAGSHQQLKTNAEELKNIDAVEKKLTDQYRKGCNLVQMISELNGSEEGPGLILALDAELQKPVAQKSNLTSADSQALKQSAETNLIELTAKQKELANVSQLISFKQLYESVTQLQNNSPEHCPACQTPLTQATVNPYTHAGEELRKLQHLSELQEAVNKLSDNVGQTLTELSQIVDTCCTYLPADKQLSALKLLPGKSANIEWWNSLHQQSEKGFVPWNYLKTQIKVFEETDKEIDQVAQKRIAKQEELKRLREFERQITVIQTRRKTADEAITTAKDTIEKFDESNAQLLADVEAEKSVVTQNQVIASAYKAFVQKLNTYRNALPSQLVADLGETVVTLYNAFNRNDAPHEQLSAVRLPVSQNQRLELSFQSNSDAFLDALHVLSEGHIRCLGLAILAAKNLKTNCPFLIFDDPVNAIDDDHREAIRKTLFEDTYFATKQIILTCHGEEFFKDIQNLLSAERASQSKFFSFLPQLDEQHIRIDFDCAPRNYIVASRAHLNKGEKRDALAKSRQALESLAKGKIWPYVNRYGDSNLSIKLRSAKTSIELRNLTEQLESKIKKNDFADPNKDKVLNPIEKLLGINGDSREWRYLNKGTHEEADRAEFDPATVGEIVDALELIDAAFE